MLIDKPSGITSHDCVAKLRKLTGIQRIGHAGTLDPLATGVLVVLVGSATRLSEKLSGHNKSYEATITFGSTTSTDDSEGDVLATSSVASRLFDEKQVAEIVQSLVGKHQQTPPQFSALKVEGQRAHTLARKGEAVAVKSREIEIFSADILHIDKSSLTWTLSLKVSKGTYIRSIARDLGEKLGCGAHISALRRTAVFDDRLTLADAHTLEEVEQGLAGECRVSDFFVNPLRLLDDQPRITTSDYETRDGRFQFLVAQPSTQLAGKNIALISEDGRLLGFGYYDPNDGARQLSAGRSLFRIRPRTIFPGGVSPRRLGPSVATVGVFDGVHRGHATLIDEVVSVAREKGLTSVVFTFDPSPKDFFSQHPVPPLSSLHQRIERIKERGVDDVIIIPFTHELSQLAGRAFVEEVLLEKADLKEVVVGQDFKMGKGAETDAAALKAILDEKSINLKTLSLVDHQSLRVSSSRIRSLLSKSRVEEAAELLGRDITFRGFVTHGSSMGSKLGYPTANITPEIPFVLADGVYSAYITRDGVDYKAGLFVGVPRNDHQTRTFEAHLLDFHESIYGEEVEVHVLSKVNDTQRFGSFEELKAGVEHNVALVRQYFA